MSKGLIGGKRAGVDEKNAWRQENPKYQERTAGGVYFWGKAGTFISADIDPVGYKALPVKAKKAVIGLYVSEPSEDGKHYSIYYVNSEGIVEWFDEYGRSDFLAEVRGVTNWGDANDYDLDDYSYNMGDDLSKYRRK